MGRSDERWIKDVAAGCGASNLNDATFETNPDEEKTRKAAAPVVGPLDYVHGLELRVEELEKLLGDLLRHVQKLRQDRGECPLCGRSIVEGAQLGQDCEDGCFVALLEVMVPERKDDDE